MFFAYMKIWMQRSSNHKSHEGWRIDKWHGFACAPKSSKTRIKLSVESLGDPQALSTLLSLNLLRSLVSPVNQLVADVVQTVDTILPTKPAVAANRRCSCAGRCYADAVHCACQPGR